MPVAQIAVDGFAFNGPGSYLRNPWNVLDFAIVVIGKSYPQPLLLRGYA